MATVTQVVGTHESHLFHNRLTHSLKVGQLARRIAGTLLDPKRTDPEIIFRTGGLDVDVAEAAGLAHDLGHPPFGHTAEYELQKQLDRKQILPDAFEGNAQSFRIVTKLSPRDFDEPALNLTRATLRAILKYPWLRRDNPKPNSNKWGAYDTEKPDLNWAVEDEQPNMRSVEAQIMDKADDMAYCLHDLEDFYRAGLIPLDRLAHDASERDAFLRDAEKDKLNATDHPDAREIFEELSRSLFPRTRYLGRTRDRAYLHFISTELTKRWLSRIALRDEGIVWLPQRSLTEIELLKQLAWFYVIDNPGLATVQHGQREIVRGLFDRLNAWTQIQKEWTRLPIPLRIALENLDHDKDASDMGIDRNRLRLRAVVDYIAGLTETQASQLYGRLTGMRGASVLELGVW